MRYKARPISAPVIEGQYRARNVTNEALREFAESAGWKTWPPAVLELKALTLIATYYSPALDVARAQIKIADAAVKGASARINPSLSADGGYSAEPGAHPIYGISPDFTIETAGKRGDRILEAEKNADATRLAFAEAQWSLWSKVRSALIDYVLAERRVKLLAQERRVRNEIVEMLDKRLSVGAASQPEVDVYRVALLRAEAALEAARGAASQKRVALATAMGIPPNALGAREIQYRFLNKPPADISVSLRKVERAGLLHRIDVRRMLVQYAAADAALRLEIARQYPNIQLGPSYGFEEGFARYTFSAVSALPIFNRNKGPIYAAEAKRRQVKAQFLSLQSHAIGQMSGALALYNSALKEWRQETHRVLSLQRTRVQAARKALQIGQGDRLSLALAQLEMNTASLARLGALVHMQTALGALEDSVQKPLEPGVHVPQAPEANPRQEVAH